MKSLTCNYFDNHRCRSCSLLSQAAEQRSSYKQNSFLELFASEIAKGCAHRPLWVPETIFPSRLKAKLSVAGTTKAPIIGLLDREFNGIELLHCPLHLPAINRLLADLPEFIRTNKLTPYQVKSRKGELKGVIVQSNHSQDEVLLRFILRSTEAVPRIEKSKQELLDSHPNLKVLSVNIQPVPHQIVEGDLEQILSDRDVIWETYNNLQCAFAPQSFVQVTHATAEALYAYVAELVAQQTPTLVFDLFCGVGGFSLHAAAHCKNLVGIEVSEQAVRCANRSAPRNGISNVDFHAADVSKYLSSYAGPSPDLLICNPPRRGLTAQLVAQLLTLAPRQIIYSSCNPSSLLDDIRIFEEGYQLTCLAPFDMFPLTEHMEVVAQLVRKDGMH